jgi:hypothetical protein
MLTNEKLRQYGLIVRKAQLRFRSSLHDSLGDSSAVASNICRPVLPDETRPDHDEDVKLVVDKTTNSADSLLCLEKVFSRDELNDCLARDPETDDFGQQFFGIRECSLNDSGCP